MDPLLFPFFVLVVGFLLICYGGSNWIHGTGHGTTILSSGSIVFVLGLMWFIKLMCS